MPKKFFVILATVVTLGLTVFCVVWALIFRFNPINPSQMSPLFNLLWTAFAGLGLVVAQKGSFKTLPNMIGSAAFGPIYGFCFFALLNLLMGWGLSPIVSFGICALLVTYLLALVHVVFLKDTWFNAVAFTLGTYGIWFALKDNANPSNLNWLYGYFFFMIGTAYSTLFEPITVAIFKKLEKPAPAAR
jgi:hypothetical protein